MLMLQYNTFERLAFLYRWSLMTAHLVGLGLFGTRMAILSTYTHIPNLPPMFDDQSLATGRHK
jgi:hypothetical protein